MKTFLCPRFFRSSCPSAASRAAAWLLLLVLCAAAAACKKKPAEPAAEPVAEQAPPPPKEEPPVELKAKWPVGKRFVLNNESVQETVITNSAVPAPMRIESSQSQELALSVVKEREGGGREIEVEFLGFKFDSRQPGGAAMRFDSASDPKGDKTNFFGAALRKLIGAKVKYLTGPDGKVEKVEGVEELVKKAVSGTPTSIATIMRPMLTEENLKKWGITSIGLPDKPVKPGEMWPVNHTMTLPAFGTLVLDLTCKFRGPEDHSARKCAAIEFTGSVSNIIAKPASATPQNAPAAVTFEDGVTSGQIWYDLASGMILENAGEMSFTIRRSLPNGGTFASTTKQKTTSRITQISNLDGSGAEVIKSDAKPVAPKPAKAVDPAAPDMKNPPPSNPVPPAPAKK